MMFNMKVVSLLLGLMTVSAAFSHPFSSQSSVIPLGAVNIAPGETYKVDLSKFYDDVTYVFKCDIQYEKLPNVDEETHIQVFCPLNMYIYTDKTTFGYCEGTVGKLVTIMAKGSQLWINGVNKTHAIQIRNIDYGNVMIANCSGRPLLTRNS